MIVPVFVDDITITSKSKRRTDEIIEILEKNFNVKRLGPISFLLGMKVERNRKRRTLWISQRQYIVDLLERFDGIS